MPPEEKASILLVNDNPANLMAIEAVLSDLGQNLVKAQSGEEALRQILNEDFCVVLLDVNMPGLDGFETAALIRQRQRSEHTPIIFITAVHRTETHAARGYSLGAVDYIFTPIVPEILRTKVSVFVNLYKMTAQIKRQAEQLEIANQGLRKEIAERRRAEQEVERLNVDLARRAAELEVANRELEAFSSSVSHDLRAPLRSIHGFNQMLLTDYADKLDAGGQDHLRRIQAAVERMSQLIDDLLKLAHVSRAEMRRSPVDLSVLATTVATELQKSQPERQVEFVITPGLEAQGDASLLQIVLENLLGNAWKFTGRRPTARIEIGTTQVDRKPVFFVRDNGAGFDPAYTDKLFNAFSRLHSAAEYPGTGIGLAIVQRIIHRHGGRVWAEGAVDQGATFYFSLARLP